MNNVVMAAGTIIKKAPIKTIGEYPLKVLRFKLKAVSGNHNAYLDCTAFGKNAEKIDMLAENTCIAITGRFHSGSYINKDGNKKTTATIVVQELVIGKHQSENTILLSGRTTRNAEIRESERGTTTRFCLAVNISKDSTDFINCVCFDSQIIEKGTKLLLKGHVQTRSYENMGGDVIYVTEVVADYIAVDTRIDSDTTTIVTTKDNIENGKTSTDTTKTVKINGFEEYDDDLPFD